MMPCAESHLRVNQNFILSFRSVFVERAVNAATVTYDAVSYTHLDVYKRQDWKGLTVDGQGADFIFHGRMLPLSLLRSEKCTLRNFSIDFETPHIAQVKILESGEEGITFEPAAWVKCRKMCIRDSSCKVP